MNNVILIGRLTKDAETRYTQDQTAITRFTLAVDRRNSRNEADFISCVSFSKTAEFISKYFSKGKKICIRGHIQTGSYTDQSGNKVYTTDVIADDAEFVEAKTDQNGYQAQPQGYAVSQNGYVAPTQPQTGYNLLHQKEYQLPPQNGYYQQTIDQYRG